MNIEIKKINKTSKLYDKAIKFLEKRLVEDKSE